MIFLVSQRVIVIVGPGVPGGYYRIKLQSAVAGVALITGISLSYGIDNRPRGPS
jgi:hypothetical protein